MKSIPRRRLSDYVEEEIVKLITSGEVEPGDRLPSERGLMEMFEVGRPSVREALFAVEKKGMIKLGRGDRPRVIQPNPAVLFDNLSDVAEGLLNRPEGVRHFNEARLLFECSLARYAALHAEESDNEHIKDILDRSGECTGNPAKFRVLDIAFHRCLAELPGNPIYIAIHEALVEWVFDRRVVDGDIQTFNEQSLIGHRAVLDSIKAKSSEKADEAMRAHLSRAEVQWEPYSTP